MAFDILLITAIGMDLIFGDPRWLPHPVKVIGLFAQTVETQVRKLFEYLYLAGSITFVLVVGATWSLTYFFLFFSIQLSPMLGTGMAVILLYLSVAMKDLILHAKEVYKKLETNNDEEQARSAVAMIVGRDTQSLTKSGIIKACIESVAENSVDGVMAPLFWAVIVSLFAPFSGLNEIGMAGIGAITYKSINTLDSMFGYRNEKYGQFGWFSAKFDDLVNWPVARLSGFMLVAASFCLGMDWRRSLSVFLNDRLKHSSPNSGHPEAAVAGALGVKLGGSSSYGGLSVYKPTIGVATRRVQSKDIITTNKLVLVACLFFIFMMLGMRQLVLQILQ